MLARTLVTKGLANPLWHALLTYYPDVQGTVADALSLPFNVSGWLAKAQRACFASEIVTTIYSSTDNIQHTVIIINMQCWNVGDFLLQKLQW